MDILVTTTGSYPPIRDELGRIMIEQSIKRAINAQIRSGVDILVDGQVRNDIVGLFAQEIGLEGSRLPYSAPNILKKPERSNTLDDLRIAAKYAQGRPLKAHLTGPTVIAESCLSSKQNTHARYLGSTGFQNLAMDIANVLAEESTQIANLSDSLNVQYLQIDEPSLTFGANLELAAQAIDKITSAWRVASNGKVILHVCGDTAAIIRDLVAMPVDILSIESDTLQTLDQEQTRSLIDSNKLLALGIVPVNIDEIPSIQRITREVIYMATRFGEQQIWGLTPACGLRLSPEDKARERILRLVETASNLRKRLY